MKTPGSRIRGSGGEKLGQGVFPYVLVSAVLVLFIVVFVTTPTRGSDRFVELTAPGDMDAYVAADPPDLRLGVGGEILVSRISVPQANLGAYLSQQRPGWDGKMVSMAADMSLPHGEVLRFARVLSGMGIQKVYYVTPDNKLKLLTAVTSARSSNRNV